MNKDDFDLVIIGAGIIGVCAAWYARKRYPQWNILLLDQSGVGSGATSYSASLDIPYGHTPLRYKLSKRSRELYKALRTELPTLPIKDLEFYGISQEANAHHILERLTQHGAKLSPQIIPSILNTHSYLKFQEHTTVISGLYAAQAINNEVAGILAKDFGKTPYSFIRCETKITAVTPDGSWYNLQAANDIHFRSKRVIQSTGPWINQILGGVESTFTTRIKKIVAFHIQQPPEANDPVFYFFDDDAFLMPKYETGYWLFSFRCDHWDVVPEINKLSIDVNDIQKAQRILRKYAPEFALLCAEGRVFCDAYTNDGDPIIEEVENCPNYVIAGAGAGSGYRLAPAIATEALNIFSKTDTAEFPK